jgi:hypothetical protein
MHSLIACIASIERYLMKTVLGQSQQDRFQLSNIYMKITVLPNLVVQSR